VHGFVCLRHKLRVRLYVIVFVCVCSRVCVCMCALQAIVVNLVFDSEETRQLGVDRHICELQLLTSGFDDIAQVM
jgi:hypothetical protein